MNKRIILVGKAGSGKDFLKQKFVNRGFKLDVSFTTRPPRTGEIDGQDYHFAQKDVFLDLVSKNRFYQHKEFNGWFYGTHIDSWENSDIFIMTPSGIAEIKPEDRTSCFIIYLDVPYAVRKERLSMRSDADSVERRLVADANDFKDFTDYDVRITNSDF